MSRSQHNGCFAVPLPVYVRHYSQCERWDLLVACVTKIAIKYCGSRDPEIIKQARLARIIVLMRMDEGAPCDQQTSWFIPGYWLLAGVIETADLSEQLIRCRVNSSIRRQQLVERTRARQIAAADLSTTYFCANPRPAPPRAASCKLYSPANNFTKHDEVIKLPHK